MLGIRREGSAILVVEVGLEEDEPLERGLVDVNLKVAIVEEKTAAAFGDWDSGRVGLGSEGLKFTERKISAGLDSLTIVLIVPIDE